ncbi:hypothetical protein [Alloactinosynnema sp. L-07]|uniref:hypothetical protein n=1 Tax=Alloactinosynnema sp. L-07 TaxID=1653480 RepID=UPI00065F0AE4|nr:hypothetical protein [Alloactinosynnema sp. L-07]CRK60582.1 hypothetical protein [Alloactinosynnema sp. L-07]
MSSVEELAASLNAVIEQTQSMREQVTVAADRLEQAQTLFGRATFGSRNPQTRDAFGALRAARDAAGHAHALLVGAEKYLAVHIGQIGGSTGEEGSVAAASRGPDSAGLSEREWRLGYDPAVQRFRPGESQTARRIEDKRRTALVRSPDETGPDWIGPDGRTYDAVGNFPGEFLDRQWKKFTERIVDHMDKSYYVPVDVSQFSPEQVKRVQEFIGPLGPRVFIVGM